MSTENHAELIFEDYLRSLSLDFVHEPEVLGKNRRPDYRVVIDGKLCWFEVKELLDPEVNPIGGHDPTPPFEEKIDQARKKFAEFKDSCCILVLHSCKSIHRIAMIGTVLSAAFGERVVVEPSRGQTISDEPFRFKFFGKAKLRPNVNTTISGIIILQHFQLEWRWVEAFYRIRERIEQGEQLGLFAYAEEFELMKDLENRVEFKGCVRALTLENPYARIPIPSGNLVGPLDQRWGAKDSSGWYTLVKLGSELEKLRAREKPVPFLVL